MNTVRIGTSAKQVLKSRLRHKHQCGDITGTPPASLITDSSWAGHRAPAPALTLLTPGAGARPQSASASSPAIWGQGGQCFYSQHNECDF